MGYKVQFETGHTVEFDSEPSEADIEEAYQSISQRTAGAAPAEKKGLYDSIPEPVRNFVGGNDAALSMLGNVPAYIGSGLQGLGTLMTGQGIDKAGQAVRDFQEHNFGFGQVKPFTKEGQQVLDMVNEGMESVKDKAGAAGYQMGGELGRTNAEIAAEFSLNMLPLPGGKGVKKLGKAIESRLPAKEVPSTAPTPKDIIAAEAAAREAPAADARWGMKDGEVVNRPADLEAKAAEKVQGPKQYPADPMTSMARQLADDGMADVGINQHPAFDQMVDSLQGYTEGASTRAAVAQAAIDHRQQLMLDEIKKQATIERMARERQALMAQEDTFYLKDQARRIDEKIGRQLQAEGERRIDQMLLDDKGPIYVDPQGQAFRGDPFEEGAYEALNRQGSAMDAELTHLRGQGTPEGQPLRPLQDPVRNQIIEEAKANTEHAPNASREYPWNEKGELRAGFTLEDIKKSLEAWADRIRKGEVAPPGSDDSRKRSQTNMQGNMLPPEAKPAAPTPEQTQAAIKQQKFAKKFKNLGLDEFDVIRTKEEALELAKDAKDVAQDFGQKQLASGINTAVALSNNPILKFARTILRDARAWADGFSKKYITDKTGLTHTWSKMKANDRIAVIEALMEGDKHQIALDDAMLDKLGFNEAQRSFVKTYYEADKALLDKWNAERAKLGMEPVKERVGHFPGIFTGSYKTLVLTKDKKGQWVVADILATDTKAQQKVAQQWATEHYGKGNFKFVEQDRTGLSNHHKYYSDIFSGMNDVLAMLAQNDPRFADVQLLVDSAVKEANNRLFSFNVHELNKKGVGGNEGNRPWLSREHNATDAFKALVRYFEEGAMHHALQSPLKELKDVIADPATEHMPNAKKYLNDYMRKVQGIDLSDVGYFINGLIDAPFKFLPTVSWKDGNLKSMKAGWGVGPSVPLKTAGLIKNNMSQLFMGWFNYMFTGAQLLQPVQTGLPFMQLVANRIGANFADVPLSMAKGGTNFLALVAEDHLGRNMSIVPSHMREAYHYAKDRGMLEFSEIERAYQGTQTKLGRAKDQAAELNMRIGEQATRTPMFMSFVDLLVTNGMDVKTALPVAENLTQFTMIDYHKWERPMIYSKLGVLGGFAGGLTTFKHGLGSQQYYLGKQLVKPTVKGVSRGNAVVPIAESISVMLALAGITGLPFYGELDTMYRYLTNEFGGKATSIRESFLENNPEWLNSGAISGVTGLNVQGKFSSADMIPDTLARTLSPQLEQFGKIVSSALDMIRSGADPQAVRNFVLSVSPQGPIRGTTENLVARDANNNLIGKDGEPAVHRTDSEWTARAVTGLRSQDEAVLREKTWDARVQKRKDDERKIAISREYKRRLINNTLTPEVQKKLQKEYMDRGGQVDTLLKLHETVADEMRKTEKQRLEGTPSSAAGVQRYRYFNK